jgi:transcriptional regulator GlxA family with amidase domain
MRDKKKLAATGTKTFRASRYVVVLAVPPVEELDIVGPWEVFATTNNVLHDPRFAYQIELVSTKRKGSVIGDSGLRLSAMRYYRMVPRDIDTLIVPGGSGPIASREAAVLSWVRATARRVRRVASVCTGAFLLAQAGLLDGKRATTHWMFADEFRRRYPRIAVESDRIYIREGHIYTSAGVTAGMDLALALVEEDFGSAIALQVAQRLVLFLRRPGGQAQFSTLLSSQKSDNKPLRELQVWMAENLRQSLTVERLAFRVAMSSRNFARAFVREIGVTPARFVEQLRVEAARRELETTDHGLERIAARAGFSSAEVMRRAFQRCIGTSPNLYRDRFSSAQAAEFPA